MSLKPQLPTVPEQTAKVARAAFPKGNPYMALRDSLGSIFTDEDFADLFPTHGQPAYPPWRLALVTLLQFRENLSDRGAAEAVRDRIAWKYLLGMELTDPGFDDSVLCEFRKRLLDGGAEMRLLDTLLTRFQELGLFKKRGRMRSDSTHILAAVKELNRLEHVIETMYATLNAIARIEPEWLTEIARPIWFERYSKRVDDSKNPSGKVKRMAYLMEVAQDGFDLLGALAEETAPEAARSLEEVAYLERLWDWYFVRETPPDAPNSAVKAIRMKTKEELGPIGKRLCSPYDPEARLGHKGGTPWIGYRVHISETCEENYPRLVTHVVTKEASFHESYAAPLIHEGLSTKELLPGDHLVDTGYITAKALLDSKDRFGVKLIGATMQNSSRQQREREGFSLDDFTVDWRRKEITCPEGKVSEAWGEYESERMGKYVRIRFNASECQACEVKAKCTSSETRGRQMTLRREKAYLALARMREETKSEKDEKTTASELA